jgi:hypothetical protein
MNQGSQLQVFWAFVSKFALHFFASPQQNPMQDQGWINCVYTFAATMTEEEERAAENSFPHFTSGICSRSNLLYGSLRLLCFYGAMKMVRRSLLAY